MWVEQTKEGKFKFVERYTDYLTGKQKKVSVTLDKNTAQTRKLAQASLNAKIFDRLKGTSQPEKKSLTFEQLISLYREDQLRTVKKSTYQRNYFASNSFLNMFGRETLVSRFNARYIRDILLSTGKPSGTLNEHLSRLKAILRWGYKNDLIQDVSYLAKLEPFKDVPHREKIQDKYMELDEVRVLLENMRITKWRNLTEFQILSGLRIGETLALSIRDVDLKERLIHVSKNYDSNNKIIYDSPKNSSSIRDVFIQDELFPLCKKLRKEALMQRMITGCDHFFQDEGKLLEYYSFNSYLKDQTKKSLGRALTTHALRHTHVSLLAEQGVSLDVISRRVGHEGSQMTKRIYLHITKKMKEQDYQRLAAIRIL